MNILLDNIIFSIQRSGGVSTYWYELIKRLLNSETDFICIENEKIENIQRDRLGIPEKLIVTEFRFPLRFSQYFFLSKNILKTKVSPYIFHSSYYRVYKKKGVKNIITVYDFVYEFYRSGVFRLIHKMQKNRALKNADGIICISEHTKKDLIRIYPKIDKKKIKVIHLSAGDCYKPVKIEIEKNKKLGICSSEKYILFIGRIVDDYKNFKIAIDTVSELNEFSLYFVWGGKIKKKLHKDLNSKLKNRYKQFENLSKKDLNILYNNAFCLLYPSEYEGFGIPLLEAMRAGCPVITTTKASIPEVCGDAALMADKIDKDVFVKNIEFLKDNRFRKELKEKGFEQAKKFSWDKCFSETLEFYKQQ